jgi:hypothetical protein
MHIGLLIGPGQSNEWMVPNTEGGPTKTTFGRPMLDPAGLRSLWPRISSRLGRAGISALIINRAVGGTGMCAYWAGYCRAWFSGIVVNTGSYCLHGGHLWKVADGNLDNTQPFGTSVVSPSETPGADRIQWSDLGVAVAEDVAGGVYLRSSTRFDPNGALSGLRLAGDALVGMDRKFALISIGQGDKTAAVTRDQYFSAYEQTVLYWLEAGYEVLAGLTVIGRTAGTPEWFRDVADPAWEAVCARFASERRVHAGVNLYRHFAADSRDVFGTNISVATAPTVGLLDDLLHMNSPAYDSAADAWATRIAEVCGRRKF